MIKQDLSNLFEGAVVDTNQIDDKNTNSMADFDEAAYCSYLDGIDIDDMQKSAFLRIMWDMMRCFVEWNVPAESWGQIVETFIGAAVPASESVKQAMKET